MDVARKLDAGRWARLIAPLVALVVLSVTLSAGRSYVWCIPMQRPMPSCCLEAHRQELARERAPTIKAVKSELRVLGAVPTASEAAGAELDAPASGAILAAGVALDAALPARCDAFPIVSQPPRPIAIGPPSARGRCASLQVFRC